MLAPELYRQRCSIELITNRELRDQNIIGSVLRDFLFDLCDTLKMTPCVYETGDGPCETFQEILREWQQEKVCPSCGKILGYFSGLESIPSYLYCPTCMDKGYNEELEVILTLV